MPHNNLLKIIKLDKLFTYFFIIFFIMLLFPTSIKAQSVQDVNFTMSLDKTSINAGDSFSVVYNLSNNSTTYPLFNLKITFPFIDQLAQTTFTGSSTGLSADTLKTSGYSVSTLGTEKSLTFYLYYKTDAAITTGKNIVNNLDTTSKIQSTLSFKFSTDSTASILTKDANTALPLVAAPKPQISSLVYPAGYNGYAFSTIDSNNASSVTGFYFQSWNKLSFSDPIDLSTPDAYNALKNFTQNFDLGTADTVTVQYLFGKKGTIEMWRTTFIDTPVLYFNDTKVENSDLKYDTTSKFYTFSITNPGKYTLISNVKIQFPDSTPDKYLNLDGSVGDPYEKVEAIAEGNKISIVPDLNTGKFTFNYNFKTTGPQVVEFNTYAKNGVINNQKFNVNISGGNPSTTTTVTTTDYQPKDESAYVKIFIYTLIGILGIAVVVIVFIVVLTLYKRKKKINGKEASLTEDEEPVTFSKVEVENVLQKKKINQNLEASEDRHEIIRAKVDEKINEESQNLQNKPSIINDEDKNVDDNE